MNKFEYITKNFENIKRDIEVGITPAFVMKNYAIYSRYMYYRKQNLNKTTSALYAGDDFQISDRWVFRIIKQMEKQI